MLTCSSDLTLVTGTSTPPQMIYRLQSGKYNVEYRKVQYWNHCFFALYINDIQHAVGAECVRLFADDTALYMVNTDLKVLISSVKVKIQQLFKWCICNKLTINIDKTYFVLFHTVNKPVPDGFTEIATAHMTIKRATEMKYLGLVLDENLIIMNMSSRSVTYCWKISENLII